jgi:hypothetical protein
MVELSTSGAKVELVVNCMGVDMVGDIAIKRVGFLPSTRDDNVPDPRSGLIGWKAMGGKLILSVHHAGENSELSFEAGEQVQQILENLKEGQARKEASAHTGHQSCILRGQP